MGVVEIKDSDANRRPGASGQVFSVKDVMSSFRPLTKEQVAEMVWKVRAVLEMPHPTDVKSLLRFNGTVQYLAKFLSGLSDMTHLLRQLTRKDDEWVWSETQEKAWSDIKTAISQAPVLRFYSLEDEGTLQCDASDTGLGAALLQLQQPVWFASRALTQTETRYAQVKELLAIVFACEKFDEYTFGRDVVHVGPIITPHAEIFKKSLCDAPARLQRMLLRLQSYNLEVRYKKGPLMFIADTLSRAYVRETLLQRTWNLSSL